MAVIFMSYARADRDGVVPLARALEEHGWTVWWDRHIPPGQTFDEVIEEALDTADAVISVWTRDGVESRWVRTEAAEGLARNILVPVSLEEVQIPLAFRRIQSADLSDWEPGTEHAGFDELVDALETLIGPAVAAEPERADQHGVAAQVGRIPGAAIAVEVETEQPPEHLPVDPVEAAVALAEERAVERDWESVVEVLATVEREVADLTEVHPGFASLLSEARRRREASELYDEAEVLYGDSRWADVVARLTRVGELDPDLEFTDDLMSKAHAHIEREHQRVLAEAYDRAHEALRRREWAVAVARFERLVDEEPEHDRAVVDLAVSRAGLEADHRYRGLQEHFRSERWDDVLSGMTDLSEDFPEFGDPDDLIDRARARRAQQPGFASDQTITPAEPVVEKRPLPRSRSRAWLIAAVSSAAIALVVTAIIVVSSGGGGGVTADANVGVVYDLAGRGDLSFNDAAFAGLEEAIKDFDISAAQSTPTGEDDRAARLQALADDGNDLVIAVGFTFADALASTSADKPGTSFAILDAFVDADNVATVQFAEEEGSFLVGAAAALKSRTGTIGFIGGVNIELIRKFEAGFTAGALAVDPDIGIFVNYITQEPDFGGFNDPDGAREIARSQYGAGADVVFTAAGSSGLGAFEAATQVGDPGDVWAIGVDSDQYQLVADDIKPYVLTSMVKRVDVAVYDLIESFVDGSWTGGVRELDLSDDGVGYSTSGGFVDDIRGELDRFASQIISGEIDVPTSP